MSEIKSKFHEALKRVEAVLRQPDAPQARLDHLTKTIANAYNVAVASLYLRRAGEILELYSTYGLRGDAVHKTRLRVDEGVVGTIALTARIVNINEAASHANFAYRPETGEDNLHAMMGVPLLSGGRVIGVLTVQDFEARAFSEHEQEVLAAIAALTTKMVMGEGLLSQDDITPISSLPSWPDRLTGQLLSPGLAMGQVILHRPEMNIVETMISDQPAKEVERLYKAVANMQAALDGILARDNVEDEVEDIIRTYRILAEDPGWLKRIVGAIEGGLSAEAAVVKSRNETRSRIDRVENEELRDRLEDLIALNNRLLRHLNSDKGLPVGLGELPQKSILVARNLDAAQLLEYNLEKLQAVVLAEGTTSSHVAIVARSMNIPVLGRVRDILSKVELRDHIIVDADHGLCYLRPDETMQRNARHAIFLNQEMLESWRKERHKPATSKDKINIKLMINAGMQMDMPHLEDAGADGIGLFRTELPLMVRPQMPSCDDLLEFYRDIIHRAGDKPITFRAFDIGSDKRIPYLSIPQEANPALGWRAIRYLLDRPTILRDQMRALMLAAGGKTLRLMFPMITVVDEIRRAKSILQAEHNKLVTRGLPTPTKIQIGAMVEVPSILWQLDDLAKEVDFLSIGTNDLMQFLFAADRGNDYLEGRFDHLNISAIRFLKQLIDEAGKYDMPVSVCGEMAGKPLESLALIALGVRQLSMGPMQIGLIRRIIRKLDIAKLTDTLTQAMQSEHGSLRPVLQSFALDHGLTNDDIAQRYFLKQAQFEDRFDNFENSDM